MAALTMFDPGIAREMFNDTCCLEQLLDAIYNCHIDIKEVYQDGIIIGNEDVCGILDLHIVDQKNRHFLLKIQSTGKDLYYYYKYVHLLDFESFRIYGDFSHLVAYDVITISLEDFKTDGYFMIVGKFRYLNDLDLDDGVRYIFINHEYCECLSPLGMIIHDMNCSDPDDMCNQVLKERFSKIIKKYRHGKQD